MLVESPAVTRTRGLRRRHVVPMQQHIVQQRIRMELREVRGAAAHEPERHAARSGEDTRPLEHLAHHPGGKGDAFAVAVAAVAGTTVDGQAAVKSREVV